MNTIPYIGRFAPTPSGPLHLGSLVAALGSFLDARAHGGRWLLRVEDVDSSRSRSDYIAAQMHSLHCHGLCHDGTVRVQSAHIADYLAALDCLRPHLYPCVCSRKHWHDGARMGALGSIYPGTCRGKVLTSLAPTDAAIRLRLPDTTVTFHDRLLGDCCFSLADDIGDPVLRRRDGDIAYALAVVIDDALQGVTDVVRGQDLVAATAIHLTLQSLLGLPQPRYLHLPLLLNPDGSKLSKQNHAPALNDATPATNLLAALHHLGEDCTDYTTTMPVPSLLEEAVRRWSR
ncbi:tRNA glutamyl-Q(34) synthetase GluQRS [Cardiobacterium valvarum]|uniref:Glutamyl-Q tRNA(Asp) synthetase n=1 Tax=Cardiobacterium valvarum TaxID=194702 RepID=A0A381DZT7_9GAMM|nr:tRNA glutamyl-Q(34) synthetase GluQRS [Cardiobacterium valvarum]SUX18931.1 Glutamyl-Q tRNA(Asp) synthetase [Cardiobacterium valvarum]